MGVAAAGVAAVVFPRYGVAMSRFLRESDAEAGLSTCGPGAASVYVRGVECVYGTDDETDATTPRCTPVPCRGLEFDPVRKESAMVSSWLRELDEVLRGHKADPRLLASGTAHVPIEPLVGASILLGMTYGVCMGLYAVVTRTPPSGMQMIACAIKVPALFFLTLVVTFPSLYVFSALLGVRLNPKDTLRLILVPITVNLAVLASLGTITAFFTVSTTSYPFMTLLNVLFFSVSGVIGLKVLLTMLSRLEAAQTQGTALPPSAVLADGGGVPGPPPSESSPTPRPPRERSTARLTFQVWIVIYALVGAQMGWILRPFIGSPDLPFAWFRGRESNIFVAVVRTIGTLFGF
jgi:hypothetical protein